MSDSVRLDKWLWAARFYKMRGLATDAIKHGQIQVNGQRPKPSRTVRLDDEIHIEKAGQTWTVRVLELSDKRGSAAIAQSLYAETPDSLARREQQAAQRRAEWLSRPQPPEHRPDRRERARLRKLLQKI
nr:RNA-binding protein [Oceanococcus sp. HetDA_MAG_MS8]